MDPDLPGFVLELIVLANLMLRLTGSSLQICFPLPEENALRVVIVAGTSAKLSVCVYCGTALMQRKRPCINRRRSRLGRFSLGLNLKAICLIRSYSSSRSLTSVST